MQIDWGLLQPVDIGGNFQSGFQMGQQLVEKAKLKSALAAYSQDPTNPAVQNALAASSPEFAMQLGQYRAGEPERQQAAHEKELERNRDNIIAGGRLIRQTKPKDQASWDQTRALAAQAGIDVSQVPAEYNPEYLDGIMKLADSLDPPKVGEMPNIAREVDYYRSIGRPEMADQLLKNHAEGPPVMVDNGDGTKTLYPRSALNGQAAPTAGPQPGDIEEGHRFKGGNPADPASWEPVEPYYGGPTPQASGGFLP